MVKVHYPCIEVICRRAFMHVDRYERLDSLVNTLICEINMPSCPFSEAYPHYQRLLHAYGRYGHITN